MALTGERAFTARSVVASLLLGMRDPELPAAALVRSGLHLGVAEGTTRVALSRMVAAGELELTEGRYRLAGSLLDRHRRQEVGRRPAPRPWDGSWVVAIMGGDGTARSAPVRAATRQALHVLRLAPWRDGVWLRPDNLDTVAADGGAIDVTWLRSASFVDPAEVPALVDRLWCPSVWADTARDHLEALAAHPPGADLAAAFGHAAAVVRHLRDDPLLPAELLPADWPGSELRAAYDAYEAAFQAALRATAT